MSATEEVDGIDDPNQYQCESTNMKLVKVVPLPHARSEVWGYFGFIAADNGDIQDKKKVVCKLCATTLSYSGNTTNLFTHLKALHPEANPSKLTPTSKPVRGKKGKNKYIGFDGTDSDNQQEYIVRAITYQSDAPTFLLEDDPQPSTSGQVTEINSESVVLSSSTGQLNHMDTSEVDTSNEVSPENVPLVSCDDITNAIVKMLDEDFRPIELTQGKGFNALLKLLAPGYRIPDPAKLKVLVEKHHKEARRAYILKGYDDDC